MRIIRSHFVILNLMAKLIIIRGPSGAGKSTVSRELFKRVSAPTLLISEDVSRKMFNDHPKPAHDTSKKLAVASVLLGLQNNYNVIFEGILNIKTWDAYLDSLFEGHGSDNFMFYLDVGFDETVNRHYTRPEKSEFDVTEMKRWWDYASPLDHVKETIIPESSTLESTIQTIARASGLDLK